MRTHPIRILTWQWKLLYLVAAWVAGAILVIPFRAIPGPWAGEIASIFVNIAILVIGARLFRSKYEDPLPARPWWRMSGTVRFSARLGAALAVLSVLSVLSVVVQLRHNEAAMSSSGVNPSASGAGLAADVTLLISATVYAFCYINSALRLRRWAGYAADRAREQASRHLIRPPRSARGLQ